MLVGSLTRAECVRLDSYLKQHKLGDAGVLIAYDRREEYKNGQHPERELAALQDAAAALLHNLYLGGARQDDSGGRGGRGGGGRDAGGGRGGGRGRGGGGGGAAAEEDELINAAAEPYSDMESIPLGGASLESADDFPTLAPGGSNGGGGGGSLAPLSANWTSNANQSVFRSVAPPTAPRTAAARPDEFPALGGGQFPSLGGGGGGGGGQSLLSRWAAGNAPRVAAAPRAPQFGSIDISDGTAAPQAVAPPAQFPGLHVEAFPSLGGGRPLAARPAAAPPPNFARVANAPPVASIGAFTAAASVAPPPRTFEPQPEMFPSLGAAVAVEKAASAATIPRDRDELIARNKVLMKALHAAAARHGVPDAMLDFRQISASFQRGELTSMAYFGKFRGLFGEHAMRAHLPELILLLPDQAKREELAKILDAFDRAVPLHAAVTHAPRSGGAAGVGTFSAPATHRSGAAGGWARAR